MKAEQAQGLPADRLLLCRGRLLSATTACRRFLFFLGSGLAGDGSSHDGGSLCGGCGGSERGRPGVQVHVAPQGLLIELRDLVPPTADELHRQHVVRLGPLEHCLHHLRRQLIHLRPFLRLTTAPRLYLFLF